MWEFWGFWILYFGVWGFWILDFVTNFGFYIRRRRLCTPNRVGGFGPRITFASCDSASSFAVPVSIRNHQEPAPHSRKPAVTAVTAVTGRTLDVSRCRLQNLRHG